MMDDPINPAHYTKRSIMPVDVAEDWELNFNLGCVIKYLARYKDKGGMTDLRKALWYLKREINREEV
jgi:hypothetical protein